MGVKYHSDIVDVLDAGSRALEMTNVNRSHLLKRAADEIRRLRKERAHMLRKLDHGCWDAHCGTCDGPHKPSEIRRAREDWAAGSL